MADETAAGGGNESQAGDVIRPDALPENYWDATAKAPNYEVLGKDLTEFSTLKTERDARIAAIPKEGAYAFDLPADFKIPDGLKWNVDPNDPLAKAALGFAKAQGLTQPQFTAMTRMWADLQVAEVSAMKADQTKAAEAAANETKALGENAEGRRTAVKTWLSGDTLKLGKEQVEALTPLLSKAAGVMALERMMTALAGVKIVGNAGNGAGASRAEEFAGKTGIELLRAANAEKRG